MAGKQESEDSSAGPDAFVTLLRRVAREAGGLDELARKSGVAKRTLTDWLNGRYPRARSSRALTKLDDWALEHISPYPGSDAPGTLCELAGPVGALTDAPPPARRRFTRRLRSAPDRPGPTDRSGPSVIEAPVGVKARPFAMSTRTWAMCFLLAACTLGIVGGLNLTWLRSGPPVAISGSVRCESGADVVGVYVKMNDGIGSGFAQLSSGDGDPAKRFTLTAPADDYVVSVGCGVVGKDWKISAYTPPTSKLSADWVCDDVSPKANEWPFHGTCRPLAG